jgi:hypothetical protein
VYSWSNENGSQMTASFDNGALVSKQETDLPVVAGAGGR